MENPPKNRNRIGRSVYETHCIGSRYDPEQHKTVQFVDILPGNVRTIERATARLQKKYQTRSLLVEEIHHFKTYISAPLEKFLEIVDERSEQEID